MPTPDRGAARPGPHAGARRGWRTLAALAALAGVALLAACDRNPPLPGRVDPVALGRVIAAVVPGPDTWYLDAGERPAGLEYDLLEGFARSMRVSLELRFVDSREKAMRLAEAGQVHVVASAAYGSPPAGPLMAGPAYQTVQPVLVYRVDDSAPVGWPDLAMQPVMIGEDQPVDEFRAAAAKGSDTPAQFVAVPSSRKVAEMLASGNARYGVMYRHTLAYLRNLYLDLDAAFPIGPPREMRWRLPKSNLELAERADRYFATIRKDGTLTRLIDRYYGHMRRVDAQAAEAFHDRIRRVLPYYREMFRSAQQATGIEWRLLAAIAYQESQWDPLATSPTNVRGMMMLTEATAAEMKVSDRLDPAQSIAAGARHLAKLRDQVAPSVREPDRTWVALAAFNVGGGHVEDARVIAQRQRLNPDSWTDLKRALPLLAKPEFAARAKSGFARGGQAVIFVENVRALYDILTQFEEPHKPAVITRLDDANAPIAKAAAQALPETAALSPGL